MATTSTQLRRKWRDAWDDAPEGEGTFFAQLRLCERGAGRAVSGGSIKGTAANGRQVQVADDGAVPGMVTQLENANEWTLLVDLYETIQSRLTLQSADASESAIYTEGLATDLQPCTESYVDMTYLRLPTTLASPTT